MKRILAIARLNLLELTRDRTELVSVIVLPLLLTWVFGTAFGSAGLDRPLAVPVVDLDGSVYSKQFVSLIDGEKAYEVSAVSDAEAREAVRAGDSPVAVIVPEGFGARLSDADAELEIVSDPSSDRAMAVAEVAGGAANRIAANVAAFRATEAALWGKGGMPPLASGTPDFSAIYRTADGYWEPSAPVSVKMTTVQATGSHASELEAPANTQYSLGFTVFFVFMTAMGSAGGILEEREHGTLRRLLSAPVRRSEILGGKVAGVALVATFEAAILVLFGAVIFRVPWGKDPLAIAVLLLALVLSATGLGIMVSALVRTRSQMSALAPVLSTGLAMLGGCYWPVEIASKPMQAIALATPTGWAMTGLKNIVARGLSLDSIVVPVAVLIGMSVVFFAVGIWRLRLE